MSAWRGAGRALSSSRCAASPRRRGCPAAGGAGAGRRIDAGVLADATTLRRCRRTHRVDLGSAVPPTRRALGRARAPDPAAPPRGARHGTRRRSRLDVSRVPSPSGSRQPTRPHSRAATASRSRLAAPPPMIGDDDRSAPVQRETPPIPAGANFNVRAGSTGRRPSAVATHVADRVAGGVEGNERRRGRAVGAGGPPRVDRARPALVQVEPEHRAVRDRRRLGEPVAGAVVAGGGRRAGPAGRHLHLGDVRVVVGVVGVHDDLVAAASATAARLVDLLDVRGPRPVRSRSVR